MNTQSGLCIDQVQTVKWLISPAEKKKYAKALSECLYDLRKAAGVTQAEIADIVGVKRQTYGPLERGQQRMSWNTYMSLIFYFDYNPRTHGIIRKKGLIYSEFDNSTAYKTATVGKENGNMETKELDLFEDIRNILGLDYVSDIRFAPNTKRAISALKMADINKYPLSQLSDMANYIAGRSEPFEDYESASAFFANA